MNDDKQKYGWVEFGRGCAAFVVFIAHGFFADVPTKYSYTFLWGRWGVCFFFVLSGFIIGHVHRHDIGRPDRVANFIWRRLTRIFPTYWLALFVLLFVRNFLGNPDYKITFDAITLTQNILLWPTISELFVPMAWTLRHELLFYALFCIAIVDIRIGIAVFAGWFLLLIWHLFPQTSCELLTIAAERCIRDNANLQPLPTAGGILTQNVNLYFFVGIALVIALKKQVIEITASISIAGATVFYSFDLFFDSINAIAAGQFLTITSFVSVAILLSERSSTPKLALWFGTISYPFYLFHMTCMLIAHGIMKRLALDAPWEITALASLVLTLSVSHLVAYYYEKNIIRFLRERTESIRLYNLNLRTRAEPRDPEEAAHKRPEPVPIAAEHHPQQLNR